MQFFYSGVFFRVFQCFQYFSMFLAFSEFFSVLQCLSMFFSVFQCFLVFFNVFQWLPPRPEWWGVAWILINLGLANQKDEKNSLFEKKLIFWKKEFFFKKRSFSSFLTQPQVYGHPHNLLAIVVAWVPIIGVYNQVLGASRPI